MSQDTPVPSNQERGNDPLGKRGGGNPSLPLRKGSGWQGAAVGQSSMGMVSRGGSTDGSGRLFYRMGRAPWMEERKIPLSQLLKVMIFWRTGVSVLFL